MAGALFRQAGGSRAAAARARAQRLNCNGATANAFDLVVRRRRPISRAQLQRQAEGRAQSSISAALSRCE